MGKEKGYVLYDEVSEVLPGDLAGGADIDDVLAGLDTAGIEILEEPKDFEKKIEEAGEELIDLDLPPGLGEKVNDPVRMYLREMGTVPLLTREGEVEIARRIERGQNTVLKSIFRAPLVIQEIIGMGEEVQQDTLSARDVIQIADPMLTDEMVEEKRHEFGRQTEDVARHYKKILQCRQKLMAIPRGMKPKQYRRQLWELGRLIVRTSRLCRAIKFQSPVIRHLIGRLRAAVEELRPLENDLSKTQRKLETWPTARAEGIKELRKEQRAFGQRLQQMEEVFGASAHARDHHPGAPGSRDGQEGADRGQPAPGGEHRQALHQSRAAIPGPHSGRQHRPDEGGRQVRVPPRLQVLHLRHLVGAPGHHASHRRPGAHHPHSGAHDRDHQQADSHFAADGAGTGARAEQRGARQAVAVAGVE